MKLLRRFLIWYDIRYCKCGHSLGWHEKDGGKCLDPDCNCKVFREAKHAPL